MSIKNETKENVKSIVKKIDSQYQTPVMENILDARQVCLDEIKARQYCGYAVGEWYGKEAYTKMLLHMEKILDAYVKERNAFEESKPKIVVVSFQMCSMDRVFQIEISDQYQEIANIIISDAYDKWHEDPDGSLCNVCCEEYIISQLNHYGLKFTVISSDSKSRTKSKKKLSDEQLEKLWDELEDIPVDADECIEVDWNGFEKGTDRYEIWHWFDERHSKGVHWLLYER